MEEQLEEQKQQQQQVRVASSCRTKPPSRRASKRPRLQRPASTTTLLTPPVSQQPQFTVLSPISLSSLGQSFVSGLPVGTLAQSPGTVTLLPAGSQLFTRYMVAGEGKADTTFTLHPSSGLTLVGAAAAVQESSQLVSPLELVQLSQQGGAEVVPVDGAVLVQQEVVQAEVEAGHEHTLIEINPAPVELRLEQQREQAAVVVGGEVQAGQAEEVQGLQLDASRQLSTVQIVVLGDNSQEGDRVKETQ